MIGDGLKEAIKKNILDYGYCAFRNPVDETHYCGLVYDTGCGHQGQELDMEILYKGRRKMHKYKECKL